MAKIARVFQKIFGSTAGANELGVFGSFAAGSPATTTDPEDVQSLSNFLDGWFAAVVGENSPAIEDMNALFFLAYYQLAYLFQAGIPEWDTDTVYYTGSRVNFDGDIYVSLTDDNTGNTPPDATNWKLEGKLTIVTVTGANTFSGAYSQLILADATSASFTQTFPAASASNAGVEVTIEKTDSSANKITLSANSQKLCTQGESATFISNGTTWTLKNHYVPCGPTSVTFTCPANTYGTLTAQTSWMEREGRFARFYGRLRIGTPSSGTPAALLLPTGITIDSAYIAGANTVELGRVQRIANAAGSTPINNNDAAFVAFSDSSNTDRVVISNIVGSGEFSNRNANADWSTNDYMTFNIKIPVTDWWG